MTTRVYVDAFNLYYGALKGTPYKWLNIRKMCELMLPHLRIESVCVCVARVNARPNDPDQPLRQNIYFRALRTLPNLEIIEGHFLSHAVWMPLADPVPGGPTKVKVIKTEEKGSDVNLATALLRDAYEKRFEVAVIISGDSDLLAPVQIVIQRLNKVVGILNPRKNPSSVLQQASSSYRQLRPGVLAASQFSNPLRDAAGTFFKPPAW